MSKFAERCKNRLSRITIFFFGFGQLVSHLWPIEQFSTLDGWWIKHALIPPTHQMQSTCVCGGVQGSQIFKRNSIISIRSKVISFLVISLSPCGPCGPHIIPTSSPSSPHCPCHPHIVPIAPRRSPWLWSAPHVVPIVPVVPTSSLWSPCHLRHPYIVLTLFRRSPHHPQPPRYPVHPQVGGLVGGWVGP